MPKMKLDLPPDVKLFLCPNCGAFNREGQQRVLETIAFLVAQVGEVRVPAKVVIHGGVRVETFTDLATGDTVWRTPDSAVHYRTADSGTEET